MITPYAKLAWKEYYRIIKRRQLLWKKIKEAKHD